MPTRGFWSRLRKGRLAQLLLVYLGASWVILQIVGEIRDALQLPPWIGPVALILLIVGLVIFLATAWVQSHPLIERREEADEVPESWELDLGGALRSVTHGKLPHLTWARSLAVGTVAFALVFGTAGTYTLLRDLGVSLAPREAVAVEAPDGIAVLPFTVRGGGLDDWREGMVDLLATGLDGAGGLRAISSRTVLARWSEMAPDSAAIDEPLALEVARATGARYALLGSAVAIGPNVRLVAEVHSLDEERRLGRAQVEGDPDDVLALVDGLAMKILALIVPSASGDMPEIDLASVTTSSLPALKAYLTGEAHFRRSDFEPAIEAYERAVGYDSTFALAYFRLAQAHGWTENIGSARGRQAGDRALELVDRLPEREAMLVRGSAATRRLRAAGLPILQEAVRTYPDDAEMWYQLGESYLHVRSTLGGWDEAEDAFERAVELAPRFATYQIHLIDAALKHHADSALVAQRLSAYELLAPESSTAKRYGLAADLAFGDSATRAAGLREATTLERGPATLAGPSLTQLSSTLEHPRFSMIKERLFRTAARQTEEAPLSLRLTLIYEMILNRGQLRAAFAEMEDPPLPEDRVIRYLWFVHAVGLPVRTERLDAGMAAVDLERAERSAVFEVGTWAAERGEWDRYEAAHARLAAIVDSISTAGDTLVWHPAPAELRALGAYALWKRGRPDEALRAFEEVRDDLNSVMVRQWLAELHRDAGRLREAERYFRTLMTSSPEPLVAYELGRIYQATGRPDEAREALELFVNAWAEADLELQPMVEDAKGRLALLSADQGR